ncbi:MAG: hypothetical protein D3919_15615 [Candidatus Electrothrix sp. AW5]|nr:hypothetical protein [Candidatus Electrothrix gigas]
MNQKQSISLQFSIEEVNTLLNALGDRPYVQVVELIQKIHQQAGEQVQQNPVPPDEEPETEQEETT